MNELDQKARQRIAQLEQELEFWRNYLAMNEQAQALLGTPLKDLPPRPSTSENVSPAVDKSFAPEITPVRPANEVSLPPRRTRVTDNPKPAVVVEQAIDILRKNGVPMSRRELHTSLKLRGIEVKGSDPIKALGTMLWRGRDKLVQLEGYGYWPKTDPYKPAGYLGDLHDLLGPYTLDQAKIEPDPFG